MATTTSNAAVDGAREPASFPGAFAYEHSDVPLGMTLAEYGCERAKQARRRCVAVVLRRAAALKPSSWRPETDR